MLERVTYAGMDHALHWLLTCATPMRRRCSLAAGVCELSMGLKARVHQRHFTPARACELLTANDDIAPLAG
jgi:hypothetical protein